LIDKGRRNAKEEGDVSIKEESAMWKEEKKKKEEDVCVKK
jgi:hypothetical protein